MLARRFSLVTVCTSVKCLRMAGFHIYWTSTCNYSYRTSGSPGGSLFSLYLTAQWLFPYRNTSVLLLRYNQSFCSRHTLHVLSASTYTQRASQSLTEGVTAWYLGDPELRVMASLFLFFFFCTGSWFAFKSVLAIFPVLKSPQT